MYTRYKKVNDNTEVVNYNLVKGKRTSCPQKQTNQKLKIK